MSASTLPRRARPLGAAEVEASRRVHGANQVTRQARNSFARQFLASFGDPIIKILLIVLAINVIFLFRNFNWFEVAGIAFAIFLATFVSTLSEYGSETAFLRLQEEAEKVSCRVRRQEGVLEAPVADLVVGDLVLLQAGDRVPADGILISGNLLVDQSALNGESREASKRPAGEEKPEDWDLSCKNQLFQGAMVSAGEGVMWVCRVGDATLYGSMAREMQDETRESPLKVRLGGLARTISRLGYIAAILVACADLFNNLVIDQAFEWEQIFEVLTDLPELFGYLLHALTLAISVVVVAVPEGLPMMITVVLSSNMRRMLRDGVLVRKLVGIETSGSLNLLFTDKTGTLTRGVLTCASLLTGDGRDVPLEALRQETGLYRLFELSCVHNSGSQVSGRRAVGGNATDRALLEAVLPASAEAQGYQKVSQVPFDSARKFSAACIQGGRTLHLVKGAPEKLLPACDRYYDAQGQARPLTDRAQVEAAWKRKTRDAVRVLALAVADTAVGERGDFGRLTLLGLVCIQDGLRPEVRPAIQEVRAAGVQVVMITGDNVETAVAIAREAGLIEGSGGDGVLTHEELERLSDDALRARLPRLRVVARALPTDKSRLVDAAQKAGLVVGMTGDGINDAPALKKADVGFAMGSGTEVAKEAGDIVILDNNFASIVRAILYGRTIFKSIRKFLVYQLSMNVCAVGVSIIGPFIGIDTPVTIIQMLWINMIMDTLAGLAFAGEPPRAEYMQEAPKRREEPILNGYMLSQILCTGIYAVGLCVAFLHSGWARSLFEWEENPVRFMTAFFALFIFCDVFNAFNARTHHRHLARSLKQNRSFLIIMGLVVAVQLVMIYLGGDLFRTNGLDFWQLELVLALALTVIPVDLLRKTVMRRLHRQSTF